jgi:predicted metalloenzyme YecM
MKILHSIFLPSCWSALFILVTLAGSSHQVLAQSIRNAGTTTVKETDKRIGFRVLNWQTRHIHDTAEAEKLIASLKKIGCEVTQNVHNGHLDVRYRCASWKSITVESDEFQQQWAGWLSRHGLETVMIDPPASPGLELVRFRRSEWNNIHMHDAAEVNQLISMLTMIGCEADQHAHNGHIDVRFRCAAWTSIALHSHESAHRWQQWLNELGFETEHTH